MLKIVFFGTPDYVIPILDNLHRQYKVVGVVTQPPKPTERHQEKTFSAVDTWAYKHKLNIIHFWEEGIPPADLGVVASYGKIIPQEIISHFKYGVLNIHPSLLPKYRGASPIQSQIIDGLTETGVSIIKMDAKMDHGPIVSFQKDEIKDDDTNETLRKRLFEKAALFLMEMLPNYLNGRINLKPQNDEEATFTKIMNRDDGLVDLKKDDPKLIERKFRALSPWPGIFTFIEIDGKKLRLKINSLHMEEGKIVLDKVQLEGKRAVEFEQFKQGYPQIVL